MSLEVMRMLPEWLTENYISDLLSKYLKSPSQIKIIEVTTASEEGDNYLGCLYRLAVESNSFKTSLIVKIMPNKTQGHQFVSSFGVFQREHEMYHEVLPELYGVMKDVLGHTEYFSPYCYPTTRRDAIVLEDLRPLGYKLADRKEQLDMDHALKVLAVLAKLHAFSFIMGPDKIKHYHDIFFSRENLHISGNFMSSVLRSMCRAVSKWEGHEKYASALEQFSETAMDKYNEAVQPEPESFCVLNHGDCWTTNIMFRYCTESGSVLDAKLIDFQLGRYCSPVIDLIFFFYTSLRLDVWRQQEKLLRHYHNELTRWLSLGGCTANTYTFEDLREDMQKKLPFAIGTVSTVTALALVNKGDGPQIEKLFHENGDSSISEFDKAHSVDKFRENLQEFLPHLEKEGVLHIR